MSHQTIITERDGPAFVVTLNRLARRNALSLACIAETAAAVSEADSDPNVRAIVVTGGPDCFSAGADLNEALLVKGVADGPAFFGKLHGLANTLEALSKPVIAAIEGVCMTGGLEMALACDLRVAGRGATFAITSARIGTMAGAGGTQRLPRIVGIARALELLFAAEPIAAEEAHRIGLVNRLTEKGQALTEAKRLAAHYATRAPLSLAFAKRAVHRGMQMDLASGLDLEIQMVSAIYTTGDKQEGISAFLGKRQAKFTGR